MMTDRDHFAAAALAGLLTRREYDACEFATVCEYSYRYADAMLRERDATTESDADVRVSRTENTTDHDAAPTARAATSVSSVPLGKGLGTGDTFGPDAYRRFAGEVMNWISEATSIYEPRSDGGRRIMADACMQCWDAFNRIAYPTTDHDAAPAARAQADSDRTDKAVLRPGEGTGDTPVPYSRTDEKRGDSPAIRHTTPLRKGTPSEGSVQGDGTEPVAWIAVFDGDDADGEFVWPDKGRAIEWASTRPGVRIAPLYRQPTLTDEERGAIEGMAAYFDTRGNITLQAWGSLLRVLLMRWK